MAGAERGKIQEAGEKSEKTYYRLKARENKRMVERAGKRITSAKRGKSKRPLKRAGKKYD